LLIATGLAFFGDARAKVRQVQALQAAFRRQYSMDLFLHPAKGYLDFADKSRLAEIGVRLHLYRQLLPANLRAMFRPMRPRYYYGVYTATGGAG
jgi:hypothetical protein